MCELNKKDEFINIRATYIRVKKNISKILRPKGNWEKRTKGTETSKYLEEKK